VTTPPSSVAIITGASQGIGRETALALSNTFPRLVLVARNEPALRETAAQIHTLHASAQPEILALDLRDPVAARAIVSFALEKFARIDAVVNVAGAVPQVNLLDTTDAQWDDGFALKLHGARRLTAAAWPSLKSSSGSVIFISGNSASLPKAPFAAVATVNAAIVALSKAFADQGLIDDVQVNCVLPGPVMTGRRESYLRKWAGEHGTGVEQATGEFLHAAGIRRYGEPSEVAGLIKFLLSREARWLTGSAVRMDGGEVKTI
jgi:3-oxoacyl-[acyl-carrier protein] reductase